MEGDEVLFMRKKGLALFLMVVMTCAMVLAACIRTNKVDETPEPSAIPSATPSIVPSATPSITPAKAENFELPIQGATGYTSVLMDLKAEADVNAKSVATFEAGTAFMIVKEKGDWWLIENQSASGWLEHKYCMLNLPDVIPSILYDITNTYSSKVVSSGKYVPGITGEALYESKVFNERLGRSEYIAPVLYSMAKKIYNAQQYALEKGDSLLIYEAYRPYGVQKTILKALSKLAYSNTKVMEGISASPWSLSWFISTGISNHQRGCAIDVSLARIVAKADTWVGPYTYPEILSYTEYTMPTQIHELSIASAAFAAPVSSKSRTAWRSATLASAMNDAAINLQTYCSMAGLTPLASEWWHFNDLDAANETRGNSSDGHYYLTENYSSVP